VKKLIVLLLLTIILFVSCSAPASPVIAPELQQKLDLLVEQLEQQRLTLHVSGMAIAVVKDDEVILAHGFGISNIDTEIPVTPETIFAIGSSTKSFTSTIVGMLVDEGKMNWDDPVTKYLPYFQMNVESDNESAEVTLRDVLSHRTGFTRMGVLYASGQIPREEVLLDATKAEPYVPSCEKFYYSNVIYMSAGVAAGKADATDWDTLVTERIFEPLDMDSTTTSEIQAEKDSRLASGYLWDEDLQAYEYKPMRNIDNIGPAGAINSNVLDMAQWLRLQLGRGEYEGRRLISEENLRETWTTQIDLLGEEPADGGIAEDYEPYIGEYVANFGQFQDTVFTVLLQNDRLAVDVPDQQIFELKEPDQEGKWYFTITNDVAISFERDEASNVIGMKMYQAGMVFDLPREGFEIAPEIPLEELQKYLGSYRSEQLGITVEVLIQNNRLAADVPGQMVYELYPPDEDSMWFFRVTPDISLRFSETPDGEVESLTMYQVGQESLMPRVESHRLPTVAEIMALRDTEDNKAALEAMGNYRINSTIYSVQSGVRGTISIYVSGPDKYRVDADYGKYGYSRTVLNGDRAWVESIFGPFNELHGQLLVQAKQAHPYVMTGDWRDYFDSIKVLRADTFYGREVYVVEMKSGDLPAMTVFVDAVTGDVLLSKIISLQEGGIGIPVTVRSEDFREVYGIRAPSRSISSNELIGRTIVEDETIETNLQLDDDFFILTPPEE